MVDEDAEGVHIGGRRGEGTAETLGCVVGVGGERDDPRADLVDTEIGDEALSSSSNSTFCGRIRPCTTPWRWAEATPDATVSKMASASAVSNPRSGMRWPRCPPVISRLTMTARLGSRQ